MSPAVVAAGKAGPDSLGSVCPDERLAGPKQRVFISRPVASDGGWVSLDRRHLCRHVYRLAALYRRLAIPTFLQPLVPGASRHVPTFSDKRAVVVSWTSYSDSSLSHHNDVVGSPPGSGAAPAARAPLHGRRPGPSGDLRPCQSAVLPALLDDAVPPGPPRSCAAVARRPGRGQQRLRLWPLSKGRRRAAGDRRRTTQADSVTCGIPRRSRPSA